MRALASLLEALGLHAVVPALPPPCRGAGMPPFGDHFDVGAGRRHWRFARRQHPARHTARPRISTRCAAFVGTKPAAHYCRVRYSSQRGDRDEASRAHSRQGTESALEVRARARALEAQGRRWGIWESASRISTRPPTSRGRLRRSPAPRRHPLTRRPPASRNSRRGHRRRLGAGPRPTRSTPRQVVVTPGGPSRIMFHTIMALGRAGRR
jgi:hypothetical protein